MATKKIASGKKGKLTEAQKKRAEEISKLPEKPIKWMVSCLDDLRDFPEEVICEVGNQLNLVQHGLEPDDWKPMADVGSGACEIRIQSKDGWFRVVYVAKFENAVYALHSFQKKTNSTSKGDVDLAKERYKLAKKDSEETKK